MAMTTTHTVSIWIYIVICLYVVCIGGMDKHGGVKMGVKDPKCDNGKWKLDVDWDNSTDLQYKCQKYESEFSKAVVDEDVSLECIPPGKMPPPIHICMTKKIHYTDRPPRAGSHRPNWPVYGEYLYVPPQRWLHSLEHGGVVLVYHPCAHPTNIKVMKDVISSCIRRHIITPYRFLPENKPFAVLTYGCRLRVGEPSPKVISEIIKFIRDTALRTEETNVVRDGHYNASLIHKAEEVSDKYDSTLCPFFE